MDRVKSLGIDDNDMTEVVIEEEHKGANPKPTLYVISQSFYCCLLMKLIEFRVPMEPKNSTHFST